MNRDISHDSDMMCLHGIAEGYRDCISLRKQIVLAQGEKNSDGSEEVWANPLHEQYRAIFGSVRIV